MFSSAGNVLLLAFGFGFVIFWHELGHFLAAKWADVRVEQFAVGFGQALFSWRKGLGLRWGSTQTEYQTKLRNRVEETLAAGRRSSNRVAAVTAVAVSSHGTAAEPPGEGAATLDDLPVGDDAPHAAGDPTDVQLARAATDLGLSETEYRLNWIPLGGYVKMLGQDDLRPGIDAPDPRSYTSKPVGKRMVIVSAGVVMNVILAAIGFIVLFKVGYAVPPPIIGDVVAGSPASQAYRVGPGDKHEPSPLVPGDTILAIDGRPQYSFDKIRLNTPLLIPGEAVPVDVRRVDGKVDRVWITPLKPTDGAEFPQLGIAMAHKLALEPGDKAVDVPKVPPDQKPAEVPELSLIDVGDSVTAVQGRKVGPQDILRLVDAVRQADGAAVPVTVHRADGKVEAADLPPCFEPRFGDQPIDFAGLQMLQRAFAIAADSIFKGKLQPGDVVIDVDTDLSGGHVPMPTRDELYDAAHEAAAVNGRLQLTVLREGKPVKLDAVEFDDKHADTGVAFDAASAEPIVAHPPAGSPAAEAHVPAGARLVAVDGHRVANWFDVWRAVRQVPAGRTIPVTAAVDGHDRPFTLRGLTEDELAAIAGNRLTAYAIDTLPPATTDRKAKSLAEAGSWGVGETRDAIVQVYLTVRAMFRGGISPKELSGPVGILAVGYKFAQAGATRLLWFLSIISANLAVMNFLPIPVVDGGLFTFLVIEKLKGSPISQRTQVIAQYVGLTLLLSVFLFATWQDLFRIPALFHG